MEAWLVMRGVWIGVQESLVQPASKKLMLTPSRPSSRSTPETVTRRAVANGMTPIVPASSAMSDSVITKPNNVSINRLNEQAAAEASEPPTVVVKPSAVEAKTSAVMLPQNSAVVAPALSHSAKVCS